MVIQYVSKKITVWRMRSQPGRDSTDGGSVVCLHEFYKNASITLAMPNLMSGMAHRWKWKCEVHIVMLHGSGRASVTSSNIYSVTPEPSRNMALIYAFVESLHLCDKLGAHI